MHWHFDIIKYCTAWCCENLKKEFLLECSDKSEQIMVDTEQVILPELTEVRFVIFNKITSSFYSNTAFDYTAKQCLVPQRPK